LLSRDQSGQCPCGGVSRSGRLQSLLPAATGSDGAHVDATVGRVPDAESFSPGAVAQTRGRSQSIHPVAADGPRAAGARFKAFPIQQDEHLLTVLRYVERNPLRAGLVARAEDWLWSSLRGCDGKINDADLPIVVVHRSRKYSSMSPFAFYRERNPVPHCPLKDLVKLEDRVEAHLDAVPATCQLIGD